MWFTILLHLLSDAFLLSWGIESPSPVMRVIKKWYQWCGLCDDFLHGWVGTDFAYHCIDSMKKAHKCLLCYVVVMSLERLCEILITHQYPGKFSIHFAPKCLHDSRVVCCDSNDIFTILKLHMTQCLKCCCKNFICRSLMACYVIQAEKHRIFIYFRYNWPIQNLLDEVFPTINDIRQ